MRQTIGLVLVAVLIAATVPVAAAGSRPAVLDGRPTAMVLGSPGRRVPAGGHGDGHRHHEGAGRPRLCPGRQPGGPPGGAHPHAAGVRRGVAAAAGRLAAGAGGRWARRAPLVLLGVQRALRHGDAGGHRGPRRPRRRRERHAGRGSDRSRRLRGAVHTARGLRRSSASSNPTEPNIASVNAPAMWALGYTGQGVVVANLDSGVDVNHPDLAGRWRGGANSWFDPYGQHPSTPVDLTGHGTATMGDHGRRRRRRELDRHGARRHLDRGEDLQRQRLGHRHRDPRRVPVDPRPRRQPGHGRRAAGRQQLLGVRRTRLQPRLPARPPGAPRGRDRARVRRRQLRPRQLDQRQPGELPGGARGGRHRRDAGSSIPAPAVGPSACGETATIYPEVVAPGVNVRTADLFGLYQTTSGTSLVGAPRRGRHRAAPGRPPGSRRVHAGRGHHRVRARPGAGRPRQQLRLRRAGRPGGERPAGAGADPDADPDTHAHADPRRPDADPDADARPRRPRPRRPRRRLPARRRSRYRPSRRATGTGRSSRRSPPARSLPRGRRRRASRSSCRSTRATRSLPGRTR